MPLTAGEDQEVTFLSGIADDGTIATKSFWTWNNDNPATYSSQSYEAKWGEQIAGASGGTVTYSFDPSSNWTATEENAFSAAFSLWAAEININFTPATDPFNADITITRGSNGGANGGVDYYDPGSEGSSQLGHIDNAYISIDTSVSGFGPLGASFTDYGGYPWMTLLHEIGHTIGIGHSGPYDETVSSSTQQLTAYDDRAFSIMSYIDPTDTNAEYYSAQPGYKWGVSKGDNGSTYGDEPTTPMELDIAAAQRIYGAATSGPLASGGQTFGFNCNIAMPVGQFFDFSINTKPVITLWDGGSNNTLDLSGYSTGSIVNLHAGSFSSCDGLTNNIAIAFGTSINSAIGGAGNDILYGNDNGDSLLGGAGGDSIYGGAGNDIIAGGAGGDALFGGAGANSFLYTAQTDSTMSAADSIFDFKPGIDDIDFALASNPTSISLVHSGGSTFLFAQTAEGSMEIAAANANINGTDIEFDGRSIDDSGIHGVYIIGDNGSDNLIGSDLGDAIQGGSGNDVIIGGGGGDAIFGGAGADTFKYLAYTDSTQSAPDGIFDFATGSDKIDLIALATTNVSLIRSGGSTFLFADGAGGHLQINIANHDVNGADILTGTTHGVYMIGDNAGDTLIGSQYGDSIQGGSGNDVIIGGGGGDAIFGGAGADTFKYTSASDSTTRAPDSIFDFVSGVDKIDLSVLHTSSTDNYGVLSQSGSTFIFVHLSPGTANAQDMTIILNGTASIAANDILWGSAPSEVIATTVQSDAIAPTPSNDHSGTTQTSELGFLPDHDPMVTPFQMDHAWA